MVQVEGRDLGNVEHVVGHKHCQVDGKKPKCAVPRVHRLARTRQACNRCRLNISASSAWNPDSAWYSLG